MHPAKLLFLTLLAVLAGCTASTPKNVNDICAIFEEKSGWYDDAVNAREEWDTPIPVMMAIMHQESRFQAKAKPPRKKILGFIPGPRASDAYGYSQAKKSTWEWYKNSAGRYGADRDDFDDAIDFVGWYSEQSNQRCGISRKDPYRLYLAYHEGHGGYNRRSYRNKEWLQGVARKVERQAGTYSQQLRRCEDELDKGGWFFGLF